LQLLFYVDETSIFPIQKCYIIVNFISTKLQYKYLKY